MPLAQGHVQRHARSRTAPCAARDAHGDRQVQGRGRPRADRTLEIKVGSEDYPPDLQTLVDGVAAANDATGRKLKFLRRVPSIPMTQRAPNGACARIRTKPDSTQLGRAERLRRYTKFDGTALDGTKYRTGRNGPYVESRAARRAGFTLIELHGRGCRHDLWPAWRWRSTGTASPRARSGAQGGSVPDARRDRSVATPTREVARPLDALVTEGYMRKCRTIPSPSSSTLADRPGRARSQQPHGQPGVYDVKSGSDHRPRRTKYSDW